MSKSSVARKAVSQGSAKPVSAPAPRIHPELLMVGREVRKRPKKAKIIRSADSVIDQVRVAFSVSAIGLVVGLVLGASVPLTTYFISHYEWKEPWSVYSLLVIGGLTFSANSVYFWTKSAFRSGIKALGFVLLTEIAMVFSHISWINFLCLGILIAINAVSSGANLVIEPKVKKPSWESWT
jgi:hypothetical protein